MASVEILGGASVVSMMEQTRKNQQNALEMARKEHEKELEYRKLLNARDHDIVKVYTFPKGKKGKLCSFSYKPMSIKASKLQQTVYFLKGKITSLENCSEGKRDERAKKLQHLRCQLKYTKNQLAAEVAEMPSVNIVVTEEE